MNNMGKKIPPKITIALNAKNEWVFIDDVPQNGNQCDCFCPYCHAPLQAKKEGNKRQHHFAHMPDSECNVSHESTLHLLAKEIIEEKKAVTVPAYYPKRYTDCHEQTLENSKDYLYWEYYYDDFEDLRTDMERDNFDPYWRLRFFDSQQLRFKHVEIEKTDESNSLRADCIGTTANGIQYIIEICVTHKIDELKLEKIRKGNMNCIEIRIPKDFALNKVLLTDYLLNNTQGRVWINYPYADKMIPKQVEKAQRDAIIKQREISRVKEIPSWKCERCDGCLRQFDDLYYDYLKHYEGKLHDWAYEVYKLKPEEIIQQHIGIRRNYHKDSFVSLNNKANFIYDGSDKKKCTKTYAFFVNLPEQCEEIVSLAKDHRHCRFFITQLEYQTKQYVFCALNGFNNFDDE